MGHMGKEMLIETHMRMVNGDSETQITNKLIISYASEQWLIRKSILFLMIFRVVGA